MNQKSLPCLTVVFLCILSGNAFSQTLDWSSSFSPAWSDGATSRTANNVAPGVNVGVTITNSQAGTYQDITGSIQAPAVNTNNGRSNFFIIAGSSDCLEIDVNWTSDAAYVDVVYTFTKPVYNLLFRIGDIDKAGPSTNTFYDRVTITGLNGSASILPSSITEVNAANYVVISGNVVRATTANGQGGNAATNTTAVGSQQGTVEVGFGAQGVTQLTIRYDNHPSSQNNPALQAIAIGNLTFSLVNISGTVWNDINNSANNTFTNIFTAGETGTNAGSSLYVNLVNNAGNVVNSAAVAANGSYTITAPQNTNNLTLRLSTTQGVPGTAAPANSVPALWTNTSPLQTAGFSSGTSDITGRHFGVEQLPQSAVSVQSIIGNPGGFTTSTIPASVFQTATGGNPNTADAGTGTVTNMRITAFPTNTNAVTINTTTYINGGVCPPSTTCTNWPPAGVTVAYTNGAGPSVPIAIDPVEGNVTTVISFVAIDNAGKEDATPGSVTIPFGTIPLSGIVWNDANGNQVQDPGEQLINGTNVGGGLLAGAIFYANLVNPGGIVIASVPVQSNGQYGFPNVPRSTSNLTIQVNTVQGVIGNTKPAKLIPAGWANAGENKNSQGGPPDGTPNGEINIDAGAAIITLQNFGLDRLPVPDPKFYTIENPSINAFITLNGAGPMPGPLSGNDAEDGALGSSHIVAITSLPADGNEIWYNAAEITLGTDAVNPPAVANPFVINNFNPALLQVRATVPGTVGTSFNYAFIDAAGLQGSPASYAITWATPLPVTLTSFTGKVDDGNTLLNWKVENQEDFDRYEIEYSTSGSGNYSLIGTVYPDNRSSASFNFTHVNAIAGGTNGYYRLKMIDKNGRFKYSFIVPVRFEKGVGIDVRPTLLNRGETIRITLSGNSGNNCKIKLFDYTGRTLQEIISRGNNCLLLETGKLNAGTYLICITGEGADQSFKILVQ
ncbi:MAG: hypothetical protein ACXWV1_10395 [Chitinophagaceae bacterium]